jgi:serine/threonine protein kinase
MAADSAADCLDEQTISAFVGGELPATKLPSIESHLADCSACRGVVADAAHGVLEDTDRPRDRSSRGGSPVVTEPEDLVLSALDEGGVVAGKYLVERRLGSGGMGIVIAARHVELDQRVAIKVLHRRGEAATARFLREARTCARLTSDHIPRVFDVGRLGDGAPYIVMEYLVGEDLGRVVARGPVAITDAVRYLLDACAALSEAHAAGIVHRDLKPANVFLTTRSGGRPLVKVLDFGISKSTAAPEDGAPSEGGLTSTGAMLGSPLYMSPEQIRARKDVDTRTDIWSLGVILYELVTGRQPFRAPTLAAAAVSIAVEAPTSPAQLRPDLPPDLEAVILRCLEKEPGARFQSVKALAKALRPFSPPDIAASGADQPNAGSAMAAGAQPRRPWYRRPATWVAAIGLAISFAGATALWSRTTAADGRARERALATPDRPLPVAPPPDVPPSPSPPPAPPSVERRTADRPGAGPPPAAKRRRPSRPGPLDTPD